MSRRRRDPANPVDMAALFDALGRFRVLCAERDGARGVVEINRWLAQHFRRTLDHPLDPGARSEWYPGRPVMVLRNDYVLKLFNGDTGIVLPDASGTLMAFFPETGGGFRAVAPLRLPEHETAFATTVHKAQGSEFDEVLLLLPARPLRVATRELLYTAITRSRQAVTIVGGAEVVEAAIASPTRRVLGAGGAGSRQDRAAGILTPAARPRRTHVARRRGRTDRSDRGPGATAVVAYAPASSGEMLPKGECATDPGAATRRRATGRKAPGI